MKFVKKLIILIILIIIAIGVWIWSGAYNIAADSPHWPVTTYVINHLRERSVDVRADDITVPDLDKPALIAEGAHHYSEMCTGCHLAPGMGNTEVRQGLYPKPPDLTHFAPRPAEAFWIIKHGIKMTGMAAWGKTHSDQKIWAIVAYLQKQPQLSVAQYRKLAGLNQPHAKPLVGAESMHANITMKPARATSVPAAVVPAVAPEPARSSKAPATASSVHR